MTGGVQDWSLTAGSNGSIDPNINFAEGQSPPSLNNSARALMAAMRAFYNAIGGGITYGGSGNTYTATNASIGAWTAYAEGQIIGFEPNATNSGAATLNVDALGAKSIVKGASTALASGDLVQGAFYLLRYDGTNFCIIGSAGAGAFQPLDATLTALAALSYTSGTLYITMTAADTFALVDDATLVKTTGNQTVGGTKSFSAAPLPATDGAVAMGSAAFRWQVGYFNSLEIGGASDTTLARLAAGKLGVEGVYARLAGKTAIPIPASAMVSNTTNGAAAGVTETTTNDVMVRTYDFDQTTQEGVQFCIPMPKSWNESTVTFQPIWTASAGSAAATVVWSLRGVSLSDDDALDTAWGTEQTSSDALIATGDVHIGPESSAITIAGTPAEGDLVFFQVRRNVASDNLTADAKLIAIRLNITTNDANDA